MNYQEKLIKRHGMKDGDRLVLLANLINLDVIVEDALKKKREFALQYWHLIHAHNNPKHDYWQDD